MVTSLGKLKIHFDFRTNRPDVFRAANHIMRMTLEGKITLTYSPPNFDHAFWDSHPNLVQIKELLGLNDDDAGSRDDDDVGGDDWSDGESEDGEAGNKDDDDDDDSQDDAVAAVPTVSRNKFDLLDDEDD